MTYTKAGSSDKYIYTRTGEKREEKPNINKEQIASTYTRCMDSII